MWAHVGSPHGASFLLPADSLLSSVFLAQNRDSPAVTPDPEAPGPRPHAPALVPASLCSSPAPQPQTRSQKSFLQGLLSGRVQPRIAGAPQEPLLLAETLGGIPARGHTALVVCPPRSHMHTPTPTRPRMRTHAHMRARTCTHTHTLGTGPRSQTLPSGDLSGSKGNKDLGSSPALLTRISSGLLMSCPETATRPVTGSR